MKAFIAYLILSIFFSQMIKINNKENTFLSHSSFITIKINKSGNHSIYFNGRITIEGVYTFTKPDEIYINNVEKKNVQSQYYLEEENNTMKLLWNQKITTCSVMFFECSTIEEIDLSQFDSTDVTQMFGMFYGCSSLKHINFTNFDTSKVVFMGYMFYGCISLTSLDLSSFNTSQATWMNQMFEHCYSLISLNLSNFDTSKVTEMYQMFNNCKSLVNLDLSNFNTSKVNNMYYMFNNCTSLISLNLSNFKTSENINTTNMFSNCLNLEYLNIKNFYDYGNPDNYKNMFSETKKNLVFCVDGSDFGNIISQIEEKKCSIIDCSNEWRKNRKKLNNLDSCINNCKDDNKYEFNGNCISVCPINNTKALFNDNGNFCGIICPEENPFLVIYEDKCIKSCDINDINKTCFLTYNGSNTDELMLNNILYNLKNNTFRKDIINNCIDVMIQEKNTKFTISKLDHRITFNKGFEDCQKMSNNTFSDIYSNKPLYLLNISMTNELFENKKELYEIYYPSDNGISMIKLDLNKLDNNCFLKTELSKCSKYSIESLINDKCISCENGYYPKFNYDQDSFIKCFHSPEGYYLDQINNSYKQCYDSCKSCDKEGKELHHNCIQCKDEYIYETQINVSSAYRNCYSTFKNIPSDFLMYNKCYKNNQKLIPENNTCVKDCSKAEIYKYVFNNICYEECPNNTQISKDNKYICEIICPKEFPYELIETHKCVRECSINDIFRHKCRINYKEKNNENLSNKIVEDILNGNLREILEQILLNKTEFIYMEDYAVHQITTLDNQIGEHNLSNINFGECEKILREKYINNSDEELIIYKIENKIDSFNIPIIEYVLFNKNGSIKLNLSICDNIKVEYNIPVSINENEIYKYDPSSDFYNNECNKYSTDNNLDMTLYDRKNEFNTKNLSLCESKCEFKIYNSTMSQVICDCDIKNELTFSSNDTVNFNDLLSKIVNEKSSSNLGVTQCMNVFNSPDDIKSNSGFYLLLIILIIFIIVFIIFYVKGKNLFENKIDTIIYNKFEKNKKKKVPKKTENITTLITQNNQRKSSKRKRRKNINNNKNIKTRSENIISDKKNKKNRDNNISHKNSDKNIIIKTNKDKAIDILNTNIPDYDNDYELNNLSYLEALKYDKRSCCEYYMSLIKYKQLFAFTFCSFNDYNSGIIKKFILFLSFALHYTINALFFTDANMHQIYEDEGNYNFSYQFPKVLISAISSTVILRIILHTLVLADKSILQVKNQNTYDLAKNMKTKVLRCIKIKFAIFFVINFILLVLFWFYLTCFNAVYQNTQVYLIENTFISFGISLVYPFFINIIPSVLRMYSLDKKNKNLKINKESCLYSTSKVMQFL